MLIKEAGAGEAAMELAKAAIERQRQQLDWREASTSQAVDARACQPLPQVRISFPRVPFCSLIYLLALVGRNWTGLWHVNDDFLPF